MADYKVKLKRRQEIASGTMAFYFEKPAGFSYKAGQFGDFTMAEPPETDAEGNTRGYSHASAPYEGDLMVATRMRDTAFKRVLKTMPIGAEISLDAPYGSLTLHGDARIPAAFLSGGIGVTPVRSIVLQATHDKLPHKLVLFTSNKRPEDSAFLDDLTEAAKKNLKFTLVGTMTEMEKSAKPWSGETKFVNKAMLTKFLKDFSLPIYYLSGPKAMVAAMRKILDDAGVKDDKIRTEEFTGY
jgi:ferredoxin-NADP reductase